MNNSKYNGNVHPDEWINDIQNHFKLDCSKALSLVDVSIQLPSGIDSFEKLRDALKEDISFTIFKEKNKKKLQSLKYIPESEGDETSKFILDFRKLCYNAEINDIEEQKRYLYLSLPDENVLDGSYKMRDVNSTNELIKEFERIIKYHYGDLIRKGSIIALKHVATGKYLSSIRGLNYTTGSEAQLVFVKDLLDSDALWKITFTSDQKLASYADTNIYLKHKNSNIFLGIYGGYYKSPVTQHTEVSCYSQNQWKFNHNKLENYQGYLRSNDIINLSATKSSIRRIYLRSHDIRFTINKDTFQEVVCHNERLGGNDEWCIELIKQK
ncbi:4701_t:CDS:2 [Funneliformis geosporum]|nr:4701_t:CDS:2 [Funneliformis geosporum]